MQNLLQACDDDDLDAVRRILGASKDPNALLSVRDHQGYTALYCACRYASPNVIKAILEASDDPYKLVDEFMRTFDELPAKPRQLFISRKEDPFCIVFHERETDVLRVLLPYLAILMGFASQGFSISKTDVPRKDARELVWRTANRCRWAFLSTSLSDEVARALTEYL